MVDYFEAKIGIGEAAHRNPVGVRESRGTLLLDYGTHGSNHQFRSRLSSPTPFPGAQGGIAAARASRSKLSASSKTAFLAPGSVNCPATSRASSARLSHSKASFNIDSIWSSLNSFVSCPLSRAKLCLRYQGHISAKAEIASQTVPQSPTARRQRHNEQWVEPCDHIAWHSIWVKSPRMDAGRKQRSDTMMALHCRSRAGPVRSSLGKRVPQTRNAQLVPYELTRDSL